MSSAADPTSSRRGWVCGLAVAVVAYVPLLLTEPGAVVADTKTYLYLDPSRLLSQAWSMWDPSIGAGTVTHQNIGYLWPMGPWFWVFDKLGVPDWIAQRLWLGTIIAVAAYGVVWMLRGLGWRGLEPWAAALLYALTPYLLTVAARISILLLPFAALPWMIGLVARALRDGGWRWPAIFALVVTTVGSVNLTALVLAGVGPLLWIAYAVATREATARRAAATVGRIAALTVPVCAWWLSGLWVQGSYGLDVLAYTETASVVALTSTANEVLRGLGYWFFYGGDKLGAWIEPGNEFTLSIPVLFLSYLIPVLALIGLAFARWRHRAFFVALVAVGTLLAVGAHPWDNPSIFGHGVEVFLQSKAGLAMRSLPRAIPLVALGLAVGLGGGAVALGRRIPRARTAAVVLLMLIAVANMPTLWRGQMVPANLQRPSDVPSYWTDAAAALDAKPHDTRVLEIPGSDFAAYRWGNTVDPVLPGLMDRPDLFRELIPYGTPASADLLIALDHRVQEGILDPGALAVIARLMSVGDVVVRSDLQYERFPTPQPRNLYATVAAEPGLGQPAMFGPPNPNVADPAHPMNDELLLQTPPSLPYPAPVTAFPVEGSQPILHTIDAGAPVIVAGDGEGLVDAAGAGLIDGTEALLYSASDANDPDALRQAVGSDGALLVTDSNRNRGRRWTSVRWNTGATQEAGTAPLVTDLTDNGLPVFPNETDASKTVAEHLGGVHALATSYGNPNTFTPEDRPANAADGDPTTAWRTAQFAKAVGARLQLQYDTPQTTDHIRVLQQQTDRQNRSITSVRLHFDDGSSVDTTLDDSSRSGSGQVLTFPSRTFSTFSIEITGDTAGSPPRYDGLDSVGFAEVSVGDDSPRLDEVIRVPTDLLSTLGTDSARHPLTFLFTRQRITPSDADRSDEEPTMRRAFSVPTSRSFTVAGQARLSALTDDATLDKLLGVTPVNGSLVATSSTRLDGDLGSRASATLDGDPTTAWVGRFGPQEGQTLTYTSATPVTTSALTLTVLADGLHSVPTSLSLVVDGHDVGPLTVPAVTDQANQGATATVTVPLPAAVTGSSWTLGIAGVREVDTQSWYRDELQAMPVGIAEVGLAGLALPAPTGGVDSGCRSDLVTLDGTPIAVDVSGTTADALAGRPLQVRSCGAAAVAATGDHILRTADGKTTGIDIDQLSLRSGTDGGPSAALGTLASEARTSSAHPDDAITPMVHVTNDSADSMDAFVVGARTGQPFWLVLGQSQTSGWTASVDGVDLGPPTLIDGYANGWRIDPTTQAMHVSLRFAPQRVVNGALLVSALAALVCLFLAFRGGRDRRKPWEIPAVVRTAPPDPTLEPAALSWSALRGEGGTRPPSGRAVAVTLCLALGALVVAGPVVALITAALAGAALVSRRARLVLALAPAGALALAAAYILIQQVRHHLAPGLEWPGELEAAHPLGWLAVTTLVADAVVAWAWTRSARSRPARARAASRARSARDDPGSA